MLLSIGRSARALCGFVIREGRRGSRMTRSALLMRAAWLLGQHRHHEPVLALDACRASPRIQDDYFRVLARPTLPYLSTALPWLTWRDLHAEHCTFVATTLGASLYEQIATTGVKLWRQVHDGQELGIDLCGPCPHREGGLTLVFKLQQVPIYRLAFSVVKSHRFADAPAPDAHSLSLYIGHVQGYPGEFSRIKAATGLCKDIAPPDLLVSCLLGLASAMSIKEIRAVTDEASSSHKRMTELPNRFNYAHFWQEHWGAQRQATHFRISLPLADKPLSDVRAKHRGRTQLKRQFKQALSTTVMQRWNALLGLAQLKEPTHPIAANRQSVGVPVLAGFKPSLPLPFASRAKPTPAGLLRRPRYARAAAHPQA